MKPEQIKDLPYYKIFTEEERFASLAGMPYYCVICKQVAFYCDILNLEDHPYLIQVAHVVCPKCRKKYNASYQRKKKKHFDKIEK